MNAGHALRFTKGNKQLGRQRRPVLPTKDDVAILRRAASGFVLVTMIEGKRRYTYEDGAPVTLRCTTKDLNGEHHFQRLVNEGWLVPEKGGGLFGDEPQKYFARRP